MRDVRELGEREKECDISKLSPAISLLVLIRADTILSGFVIISYELLFLFEDENVLLSTVYKRRTNNSRDVVLPRSLGPPSSGKVVFRSETSVLRPTKSNFYCSEDLHA